MAAVGACFVIVAAFLLVVSAVPNGRVRRNYVDGYLFDGLEDASIAGDHIICVGVDCSYFDFDSDSDESIDREYIIITKRDAPEDKITHSILKRSDSASDASPSAHS